MDCIEKYDETSLTPKQIFYSYLNKENITEEDSKNVQEIQKVFNEKNLREFTMIYNKIDVLLLTDIIENFCELSLKTYKIDLSQSYYTTPGFAWNCMLRKTDVKLELLTDLFIKKGLRVGMTQ